MNDFQFVQVPPPERARVHQIGETLGLCTGLRAERSDRQFRCNACRQMQPHGAWLVWVPDSVRPGDPGWSVEEAARLNYLNGHSSGWCFECAPKAPAAKLEPMIRAANPVAESTIAETLRKLMRKLSVR